MMVYLAGRFDHQERFREYEEDLRSIGHKVISHWIHHDQGGRAGGQLTQQEMEAWAEEDLNDVSVADCLIAFTEKREAGFTKGGRHVEFGYALSQATKLTIVVGPPENVFYSLADYQVDDWDDAMGILAKEAGVAVV